MRCRPWGCRESSRFPGLVLAAALGGPDLHRPDPGLRFVDLYERALLAIGAKAFLTRPRHRTGATAWTLVGARHAGEKKGVQAPLLKYQKKTNRPHGGILQGDRHLC